MTKKRTNLYINIIILSIILCTIDSLGDIKPVYNIRSKIIKTAIFYIDTKYNYGGIESTGFVMYIYKKNGIMLPRTSSSQYRKGEKISFKKILPGDLVFFKINKKKISHVGIYMGNNQFIHSPKTGKKVKIDNMNIKYWKLRFAGSVSYLKH